MTQVIIIGGGLAGLSSAHTVLEHGGRVLVLDKNAFLGGNSTKATSGINGALTRTQVKLGIKDSVEAFYEDTAKSARGILRPEIAKVLTYESGPAVEWLQTKFALDLSLVSRLGGHSFPRTHRGKERFPGMTITMALLETLEEVCKNQPQVARIITKARATKLLTEEGGEVIGVEYEKDGKTLTEHGPVILATGGYGADFSDDSILKKVRPDLLYLPTTNGDHCTGDGIKMALDVGANPADLEWVQVHPTGLVDPNEPDAKLKFLAAEALRGVGGLLLDKDGNRFCNELGHRDYVTGEMWKKKNPPYRLILNGAGSKEIEWHCKHYVGRGLMKKYSDGAALAKDMGIPASKLEATYKKYNDEATPEKDEFGKKFFHNLPFKMNDEFHVAIVTPVIHYCMGGIEIDKEASCVGKSGPIRGLYATGEVCGGVHGENRLGGNSLLDCVVFGRVSGATAARHLMQNLTNNAQNGAATRRIATMGRQLTTPSISITVEPNGQRLNLEVNWGEGGMNVSSSSSSTSPSHSQSSTSHTPIPTTSSSTSSSSTSTSAPKAAEAPKAAAAKQPMKEYTKEDVAKHNSEKDCWVVVNGQVLDVTHFLKDHPGGKKAILLYAGKDATEEFNMLHKPDVVEKYSPESIIGTYKK